MEDASWENATRWSKQARHRTAEVKTKAEPRVRAFLFIPGQATACYYHDDTAVTAGCAVVFPYDLASRGNGGHRTERFQAPDQFRG